jgi:G3E family GTPase
MNDNDKTQNGTIPVTILTGFLGSGKTTMLAKLLRDPRFAHTAVIINEFGEVGLDHELLEQSRDELVLLSNGCVCCTVRSDLISTLARIHVQRGRFAIDRVIVETTGLADPAPILHTLMADPAVTARFRLEHLVTTVDAVNGLHTLKEHAVAMKQAAIADRLVLTKLDLADDATSSALRAHLRALNKLAPMHAANHGEIDPSLLFMSEAARRQGAWNGAWLQEEGAEHEGHAHEDHDHHGHDHPHGEHDSEIRSFSVIRDEAVTWEKFARWLDLIGAMRGDDLLRVKGIVNVADHPDKPVVIHGVQHIFHPPRILDNWPGEDKRTRLVFITRNIEQEDIELTLQVFEHKK